jgi:hypothetical protein
MNGGRSGIRTHGELAPTAVFKTAALNRSAILPQTDDTCIQMCGAKRQQPYCPDPAATSRRKRYFQHGDLALERLPVERTHVIGNGSLKINQEFLRAVAVAASAWRPLTSGERVRSASAGLQSTTEGRNEKRQCSKRRRAPSNGCGAGQLAFGVRMLSRTRAAPHARLLKLYWRVEKSNIKVYV